MCRVRLLVALIMTFLGIVCHAQTNLRIHHPDGTHTDLLIVTSRTGLTR